MTRAGPWLRGALWAGFGALASPACSLGQGSGVVQGVLDVPTCWSGPFDLHPDFFAAVPSVSGGYRPAATQFRSESKTAVTTRRSAMDSPSSSTTPAKFAEIPGRAGLHGQAC